jgi:Zn-dependent protease
VDIANLIQTLAIYALPVLFAITVHEAAHAYVARYLGDDTAWLLGRVTLNPIKHIDPVGTVLIPLVLYIASSGAFMFGYAKPVPVRFDKLGHPQRDMVWVALAGPGANFAMALGWTVLYLLLMAAGVQEAFFLRMCEAGMLVNVVMFALNLFPLPPLDGGRVLAGLLPARPAELLSRVEPWGFFIVMALIYMEILNAIWMKPVMHWTMGVLQWLTLPFLALLR